MSHFSDKNIPKIVTEKIIEEYRIKSLYLAKCAHEIKNILISITSFIENSKITIIENNEEEKEKSDKSKNFLKSLCDLGMNIIFEINRLSKEEHINELHIINEKIEQFNAIDVLNFCVQMFESRILFEKKEIKIEKNFKIPENKKINSISQFKFKQVLINLLSNSYKFTIKGYIKLSIEKNKNNKIKITISDSGIGFSKNELNEINTPFYMIKNNEYLNKNGSGLGLYITNEILQFCGSQLKYESKKGVGTTFWFELDDYNIIDPTYIINDNFKQLISDINNGFKDNNCFFSNNTTLELSSSKFNKSENLNDNNDSLKSKTFETKILKNKKKKSSSLFFKKYSINKNNLGFSHIRAYTISNDLSKKRREEIFNQKNLKILICDDDRYTTLSTRNSILKYFQLIKNNINLPEIILCQNGIECLYLIYNNYLKDNSINILFIDLNMPFIDGITICSIIKNSIEFSDIKIYILSSGNINISDCKADGFYLKPLTINSLKTIF